MLSKGPHISIEASSLVPRVLRISEKDFFEWPISVRESTISIAEELFLTLCNPYISTEIVKKSVSEQFNTLRKGLAHHYATSIEEGITMFWSALENNERFRKDLITRLQQVVPASIIDTSRHSRVANATDATDLRLELPLLILTPENADEVSAIVKLANEMQFAIIPRGGGSGLTGGAIPARKRSVVMNMARMTKISPVNVENKTITVEAGVITNNVFLEADRHGLLFSVDPASKVASTIGGNIAENAGGPLAFEYGTTIDNLVSYKMVTATGEIIEISRKDHPGHKIMTDEICTFEVRDLSGGLRSIIKIAGSKIRKNGLGKDVTNKTLNGLPGIQKEGTDGIILEATFILHEKLQHYKVLVLEFFGRSMETSMKFINDLVTLRDTIRKQGDHVKITALEEFGTKYVHAIGYQKKSSIHEGDPISVLILQLDSNEEEALSQYVSEIVNNCARYSEVACFVAKDSVEAEIFWEDRHKLSAIAKKTSGFKINEDVVIPLHAIKEFAHYLEALNLEYMARAYRTALKETSSLSGVHEEDQRIVEELAYASKIINKKITSEELSDQELQLHALLVLRSLGEEYPALTNKMATIEKKMLDTCICVASHMHAGDGNWHVNIPVNSNDTVMLHNAEKVALKVMKKAQELGGEVTGEHGIGITKIAFLSDEKLQKFSEFKHMVDPRNILNPAKLTQRNLPVAPFTFSFNRLIEDLNYSGLADKERLIFLLSKVQVCTRCGKCKQFCPMYSPEKGLTFHPRNKNMVIGALIEAIYYTQVNTGKSDPFLLGELRNIVEHCTGCGKCQAVCPINIGSAEIALNLRNYLKDEGAGGHPIKNKILQYIAKDPANLVPHVGKVAYFGQRFQNKIVQSLPTKWKQKVANPLFSTLGPKTGYQNLSETLHLHKGSLFVPKGTVKGTVLYFPGCGSGVFFRNIGLAGVILTLSAGYAVLLPSQHLCCGYPLLAAGQHDEFATNKDKNIRQLKEDLKKAAQKGYTVSTVLTSCGSCRDGMERHFISQILDKNHGKDVVIDDVTNFLFRELDAFSNKESSTCISCLSQEGCYPSEQNQKILYHAPCHTETSGVKKTVAAKKYASSFAEYTGAQVFVSPGCCGESGLGALTSPSIYNKIRERKSEQLDKDFSEHGGDIPIVVTCPSCKIGISRILLQKEKKQSVLHILEYLAKQLLGKNSRRKCQKLLASSEEKNGIRTIDTKKLPFILPTGEEGEEWETLPDGANLPCCSPTDEELKKSDKETRSKE